MYNRISYFLNQGNHIFLAVLDKSYFKIFEKN